MGPTRESLAWNPGRQTVHADVAAPDEVLLEPVFWSLFSVGGFITAFLLPVTLFLLFFAAPFHLWPGDPAAYATFLAHWKEPLVRLAFLVVRFGFFAGAFFAGAFFAGVFLAGAFRVAFGGAGSVDGTSL